MIADEERVVGRDEAVVEDLERRLELRRPRRQHDQRTLLGEGDQPSMAVRDGQVDARVLRARRATERAQADRGGDAGAAGDDEPAAQAVAGSVRHADSL